MDAFTSAEILGTLFATACFLILFLPPGFLLGWALDLCRFRGRSATEQLLWSASLSVPLNLVLTNVPARLLPQWAMSALLLLLDAAAVGLLLQQWRTGRLRPFHLVTGDRRVLWCLLGFLLYIPLAGAPLQWHGRLFEPVFSSDWEIRLPLIRTSVQDGVPPHNPFFTFHGASPAVRYYYYWFSLCADLIHLVHTDARATLLASSAYAGLCLIATLFLCLKYLLPAREDLRRRCFLLLGLCCVLGLDILPSFLGLFTWNTRLQPEIEWWLTDRSPGLLGAVMYAPHHIAGAGCGFLLLLIFEQLRQEQPEALARRTALYGGVVGLTFAAMAGTSTFVTMFFAVATGLLFVQALWRRELTLPFCFFVATAVSLALSAVYLRELMARTVSTTDAPHQPAAHLLGLALRHSAHAHLLMLRCFQHGHLRLPGRAVRLVLRSLLLLGMFVCELGFFLVVAAVQLWRDFRPSSKLSQGAASLWILAGTVLVFSLAITSAPVQFVNDLGVHAGLILRMVLTLYGANLLAWYLAERKHRRWSTGQKRLIQLAAVMLILGVGTALWQVALERTYLMLLNAHMIPAAEPFHAANHLARLYEDVYEVQSAAGSQLPMHAVVQSNPDGSYQRIVRLYQLRRQAAGDETCEGAFGGDPALCRSYMPSILSLFGTHGYRHGYYAGLPILASNMEVAHLAEVCRAVGLTAVLATNADPVWYRRESWVWRGSLLAGNKHVRLVRCP